MKARYILLVLAGGLLLGWAWFVFGLYVIALLVIIMAWGGINVLAYNSDNKLMQSLPSLSAGAFLLGLIWLYYLYGYPDGVLSMLLLLGFPGMGLIGYAVYRIHKALLPLVFGIMWLGLMWRALAAGWTGDILIPVLAMGAPGIVLVIYSFYLFTRSSGHIATKGGRR